MNPAPPRSAGLGRPAGLDRRAGAAGPAVVARLAGVLAGLAAVLATATPAAAHGGESPDGTDYRAEVTGVAPARPGLTARVVEGGARLELVNRTGRPIEVIGYTGEPYLRVGPDGVYENSRSPATYLNRTLAGDTALPAQADPAAAPDWRRVGDGPTARWHDRRARWQESAPPAAVRADPTREQRVRDWVVPLRDGAEPVEIRGTLDWVPPPDAYPWWVAATLGFLLVGSAGLLAAGTPLGARALAGAGAALAAGGVAAIVFTVGRELDAGATGVGGVLLGLLGGQIWALLTGLGALAAGGYALARRPAADFALALAGACLALFAGVTNVAVLARSVPPLPWPGGLARTLLVLILATGAGATAAGLLRLRAAAHPAVPAPAEPVRG
ncbi:MULTISPECIES: hypothetical protein [Micromonospora]|uniref:hypothetical protein n=1 Tax=unclassified Micromonospora TaxID=2617518 RepID=UPI001E4D4AF7|nr:hypothetical protein [Micromonospora sp. NBRC 110038]